MPKKRTTFLVLLLFFLLLPKKVFAQVLNEFLPDPTSPEKEWVELYNPGHLDISSYWLDDDTSFLDDSGNSAKKSLSSIDMNSPNYPFLELSSFLNNGGDWVVLFSDDGAIIDQYQYTSDPGKDVSIGRTPDGTGGWSILVSATKGASNSTAVPSPSLTPTLTPEPTFTPTPTQVPPTSTPAPISYNNIYVSEFMPDPTSGDEWVELYNGNDFEVNFNNWFIDDIAGGGGSLRSISGTISSKSYKQFFVGSSFLNNDGDDVRLLDSSQNEKDKISYSSSTSGKSWSKDSSGNWCQIDPTPNQSNNNCPTATATPTLSPTLTPIKTPTPSVKPTVTPTPQPTLTDQYPFNQETSDQQVLGVQISPTVTPKKTTKPINVKITAVILILSGLVLLGASVFLLWRQRV